MYVGRPGRGGIRWKIFKKYLEGRINNIGLLHMEDQGKMSTRLLAYIVGPNRFVKEEQELFPTS